jgi:uncharacterized membrane protein HdeD (DUF308 family)
MLVLRGAVTILFGIFALAWPGITAVALAIVFGAYALIDGVGLLVDAFRHPDRPYRGARIAGGVLGVAAGVTTLVWPAITALALALLVGAWVVVTGVADIVAAIRYRRQIRGEVLLGLVGLVSVVAGIAILVWPAIGVLTIAIVAGIYALVAGVLLIALALRLRRVTAQPT